MIPSSQTHSLTNDEVNKIIDGLGGNIVFFRFVFESKENLSKLVVSKMKIVINILKETRPHLNLSLKTRSDYLNALAEIAFEQREVDQQYEKIEPKNEDILIQFLSPRISEFSEINQMPQMLHMPQLQDAMYNNNFFSPTDSSLPIIGIEHELIYDYYSENDYQNINYNINKIQQAYN